MLAPLTRSEFRRVTDRVINELGRKHGSQLLYVAAKGSIARDAATAYSDVDLIASSSPPRTKMKATNGYIAQLPLM